MDQSREGLDADGEVVEREEVGLREICLNRDAAGGGDDFEIVGGVNVDGDAVNLEGEEIEGELVVLAAGGAEGEMR